MLLNKVNSSVINAIGYNEGEIQVEMHNGNIYIYQNVDQVLWERFASAESKGKFFNAYIKPLDFSLMNRHSLSEPVIYFNEGNH